MLDEADCFAELEAVRIDTQEAMDVIGHYDIFPASDAVTAFAFHVLHKMVVEGVVGKERFAVECAECDEVKGRIEFMEDIRQSRWAFGVMFVHGFRVMESYYS